MRLLVLALIVSVVPASVYARGFSISDFGSVSTERQCVLKGESMFNRYKLEYDGGEVNRSKWAVFAYQLSDQNFDAVITCNYGPDEKTRATLVVHSGEGAENDVRVTVANRLRDIWESLP